MAITKKQIKDLAAAGVSATTDKFAIDQADDTTNYVTGSEIAAMTIGTLTATETELNYSSGVTSAIQTQLNAKQPLATVLTNTTASFLTAQETKVNYITITGAVDLDTLNTRVNDLDASVVLRGAWDASAGTFPGGGTAQAGDSYIVSVGGTVDSVVFTANDRIVAILDNASTATYTSNWLKLDYTDQVLSVNSMTGAVSITTITGNAGTATALETTRSIYGNNFDGTAALTGIIASTYGGTGNGFTAFSGPTTSEKTMTLPDASATLKFAGKETIWVPAGSMISATTSGAASGQIETTTNKINALTLDFDATADEYAHFAVTMPKSYNLGTVTFQAWWSTSGAVTTGVAIGLQAVAISDNEAIDTAYGTAVVVTDDAQSAAGEIYITSESSAVTIAGTPADDDVVFFRVFRDVSDGNDDMTQDMQLLGIKLLFTTDAGDDS